MIKFFFYKFITYLETKFEFRNFYIIYLKIITGIKILINKSLPKKKCEKKLDIIITVAPKDFNKVTECINSLRKYLLDKIDNIFLISPLHDDIIDISKKNNCIFIDENSLLNKEKLNIQYFYLKKDRSNWLYQQFLNYEAVIKLGNENYKLAFNADTVMTSYQKFLSGNKVLFNISDEYHKPYFNIARNILNLKKITNFSFTSHHIIYDKEVLLEMLQKIEKENDKEWINAILNKCDFDELSCHSEFETYGQFYYNFYRHKMILEYWFNFTEMKKSNMHQIRKGLFCKSISKHHWTEQEK